MTALQTQNSPAAIAVAPGHGSNIPHEETKMNEARNTTARLSLASVQLLDVANMVSVVKHLNYALFMACADVGDMDKTNALHSVIDEIENRILIIQDRLDEVREALA